MADSWTDIRNECALLENEAVLILNKPAGISVVGERHETDIVRMAQDAGEELIPVHRIDKVTSGAVLFAKTLEFHGDLTRQFNKRLVSKNYLAITQSHGLPGRGTIELPLSVGRKGRIRIGAERGNIVFDKKMSSWRVNQSDVFTHVKTHPSVTRFFKIWEDESYTLLALRPITGRRHQIRVHLAWIGYPIAGDPLFDKTSASRGLRTCLHSWRLDFNATWSDNSRVKVEAPPGADFWAPIHNQLPDGEKEVLEIARKAAKEYLG